MISSSPEPQGTKSQLEDEKRRAREQWTRNPCGAEGDRASEFGTREYFDEIERKRF